MPLFLRHHLALTQPSLALNDVYLLSEWVENLDKCSKSVLSIVFKGTVDGALAWVHQHVALFTRCFTNCVKCKSWNMCPNQRLKSIFNKTGQKVAFFFNTPVLCVPTSQHSSSQRHHFNYVVILPQLNSLFLHLLLSLYVTLNLPSMYWFKNTSAPRSLQLTKNDSSVYWEACKAHTDTAAATATTLLAPSCSTLQCYKCFQDSKVSDLNDLYVLLPTHCLSSLLM